MKILPKIYLWTAKIPLNFRSRPLLDHIELKTDKKLQNFNSTISPIVYHCIPWSSAVRTLELFRADDVTVHPTINK